MNFEEWQNKTQLCDLDYSEYDVAKMGWEACKQEMLNILKKNTHEICSHGHDAGMEYIYLQDIEKKIKEL